MKLKTFAAATLAVATVIGMSACGGSESSSDDKDHHVLAQCFRR